MLGKDLLMIIGIHFVPYQGQACYFCGLHGKLGINMALQGKSLELEAFLGMPRSHLWMLKFG